ncbi:MAG: hypothetical protein FJX88_01425 [Bacteroidetes bacterium]|nr:hypothetical protein [Bacteroidota bacterium]
MRLFIVTWIYCMIAATVCGQSGYLPREDFSGAAYTLAVHEVNFEGVDNKGGGLRLSYDKIKGSPYYNDSFQIAKFFKSNGAAAVGELKARLNLATHEVHFIGEGGKEFIAPAQLSSRITFNNGAVFMLNTSEFQFNKKSLNGYSQVLVDGRVALYKYIKRTVSSADSMFGTLKRYYFSTSQLYFVKHNNKIIQLKKMNEDAIFEIVPPDNAMTKWLSTNKMNLKREEDLVAYLKKWNEQ